MPIEVRVVAVPRSVQMPQGLGEACATLKFVAVREGDTVVAVLGYTQSHLVLALWYAFGCDMAAVARHLAKPFVAWPPEMQALHGRFVGAGRVLVAYQERQHVPAGDSVSSWESETLQVTTPESFRAELEPLLLAHVANAIAVNDQVNRPLPQRESYEG